MNSGILGKIIRNYKKTRKDSRANLKDVLPCIELDADPKVKNTNYNYKDMKVMMEYNHIPRPHFYN